VNQSELVVSVCHLLASVTSLKGNPEMLYVYLTKCQCGCDALRVLEVGIKSAATFPAIFDSAVVTGRFFHS